MECAQIDKENTGTHAVATKLRRRLRVVLGSIVVSIPACHAGDRGSIPRRGDFFYCCYRIVCFRLSIYLRVD